MRIACPSCASSYDIADERVGAGRSVRCARCRDVWFAAPDAAKGALEVAAEEANGRESRAPSAPAAAGLEGGEYNWTFALEDHPAGSTANESPTDEAPPPADADTDSFELAPEAPALSAPSIVPDAPPPPAVIEHEHAPAAPRIAAEATTPDADVETFAARRVRSRAKRKRQERRAALPLVIIGLAAVLAGLFAWRKDIVRLAPQTAPLYAAVGLPVNLRGLAFDGVRTTRETSDGVSVLIVEGTIVSVSSRAVEVPRLRFAVRNAAGLEVYAWTSVPPRTVLPPGETVEFRSRLASPPADARDVVVRFFNRRDLVAGLR
jgi:predicted Zn finger-like uncharacterized protein